MRLSILCAAALLAVGSVGVASAAIVTDGSFANTSGGTLPPGYTAMQVGWNSHVLDSWIASGYTIQYNSIADAVGPWNDTPGHGACGYTTYHQPGNYGGVPPPPNGSGGPCSTLGAVGATLPGGGAVTSFIAMDGLQSGSLQGSVKQQLSGLMTGHTYTLSFYWGGTQEVQASTPANSYDQFLHVSLGSSSQDTSHIMTTLGTFTGWNLATMTFTAGQVDPWLTFLAYGQPENGPPMITLTNVSLTQNVPEPPELAMFGLGLLGLGLLTVFARRRALRRQA